MGSRKQAGNRVEEVDQELATLVLLETLLLLIQCRIIKRMICSLRTVNLVKNQKAKVRKTLASTRKMSGEKKMARKKRQMTKKPKMRTYPMKKKAVPSSTTTRKRRMKMTAVSTKDHDVISNYTL